MNKTGKKYYTLCTYEQGQWTVQFGDYSKTIVKAAQLNYAEFKSKIIVTDGTQVAINDRIAAMNNKPMLSVFKYSDILHTLQQNPDYQHVNIFDNKKDAITHINNFTGLYTRNKTLGKFKTLLTYCVLEDELKYITVFSVKKGF